MVRVGRLEFPASCYQSKRATNCATGISIAGILLHSRLNAVTDVTVIRVHCSNSSVLGLTGMPAVHIPEIGMPPSTAVINISIAASRKRNKVDLCSFSCGIGSSCADSHKGCQAHHEGKQSRHSSLEKVLFHCVDYLLGNKKRTVQ